MLFEPAGHNRVSASSLVLVTVSTIHLPAVGFCHLQRLRSVNGMRWRQTFMIWFIIALHCVLPFGEAGLDWYTIKHYGYGIANHVVIIDRRRIPHF
jgi:hypothetical protein